MVLIERIVLSGMLLLIPHNISFLRTIFGMLFATLCAILLLLTKPYRRPLHHIVSVATHVGLEIIFIASLLVKLFARISEEAGEPVAQDVLSISSGDQIIGLILVFTVRSTSSYTHALMHSCTHVLMHSCTHALMYSWNHALMYSWNHVRM